MLLFCDVIGLLLLAALSLSEGVRIKNYTVVIPESQSFPLGWTRQPEFDDIQFALYPYYSPSPNEKFRIPVNKGGEAMTYLTFIIQFYNELPEKMAFLHGHHTAWHQGWPTSKLLSSLQWGKIDEFTNLRSCGYNPYDHVITGMHSDIQSKERGDVFESLIKFWKEFRMARYGFPRISKQTVFECYCCAQFVVNRESVIRLPKQFYVDLRTWLIETQWDSWLSGRVMEYLWHVIFTGHLRHTTPLATCQQLIALDNEVLEGKYFEIV